MIPDDFKHPKNWVSEIAEASIKRLVELKLLERIGLGRATRYRLVKKPK